MNSFCNFYSISEILPEAKRQMSLHKSLFETIDSLSPQSVLNSKPAVLTDKVIIQSGVIGNNIELIGKTVSENLFGKKNNAAYIDILADNLDRFMENTFKDMFTDIIALFYNMIVNPPFVYNNNASAAVILFSFSSLIGKELECTNEDALLVLICNAVNHAVSKRGFIRSIQKLIK